MTLKSLLFAGAAAAMMLAPASGSALAADDTYSCNGGVCYDDQADDTRALNQQALDQAQRDNEEDDVYRRDSDDNAYSYGDRDDNDMYGDDDDGDDADANPYDDDSADDDRD